VTKLKSFQWLVVCGVLSITGPGFAAGKRVTGTLIKVTDGDTVTVSAGGKNLKVRYLGMDAPEMHFNNKSQGKWGQEATDHLLEIFHAKPAKLDKSGRVLEGGEVKDRTTHKAIEVEVDLNGKDKYHRDLGYVIYKGIETNLKMVEDGYAHPYLYCTDDICDKDWFTDAKVQEYVDACKSAQKAEKGMFQKGALGLAQTASQFRRITGHSKAYQYIGDFDTKKLYEPQDYADLEDSRDAAKKPNPCVTIRFESEEKALEVGYKY
jgi:micrococcal nuclease